MEVQVRHLCDFCKGTGKNDISDVGALEEAGKHPLPGVRVLGAPIPTYEQRVREIQKCPYCTRGYNKEWISVNELLSRGIE